jgi:proteasome lid subunit RPN8/RPN11
MKTFKNNKQYMKITNDAYCAMLNYIGSRPAESGGALFGFENDYVIRHFIPDEHAITTGSSYTMDTDFLNKMIKKLYREDGLSLIGIVHSHPKGHKHLSPPDKKYFTDLLNDIPREKFYTPIVFALPDGEINVFPYFFENGLISPQSAELKFVDEDYKEEIEDSVFQSHIRQNHNNSVYIYKKEVIPIREPFLNSTVVLFLIASTIFSGFVFYVVLSIIPFLFNHH